MRGCDDECLWCIVEMQLVVVCCREMEDRCHMINALDRYRVKVSPVDESDVKSYLQQHFTVANVAGRGAALKAASSLDPERLVKDAASSSFCLTGFFSGWCRFLKAECSSCHPTSHVTAVKGILHCVSKKFPPVNCL